MTMKDGDQKQKTQIQSSLSQQERSPRAYSPPRVLSAETMEAAAAPCNPTSSIGGPGKDFPAGGGSATCTAPGS